MRLAPPSPRTTACAGHLCLLACVLLTPLASAQTASPLSHESTASAPAHEVLNPMAASWPLQHPPLPSSGTIVSQPTNWAAANAAVAQFPRGHADVLRWEQTQAASHPPPAQAASQAPHSNHSNPAPPHTGHFAHPLPHEPHAAHPSGGQP